MTLTAQALTDCRIYWATADLTGFSNSVDMGSSVVDLVTTNFASNAWTERAVGGLFDSQIGVESMWQAGDLTMPDDTYWARLTSLAPVSIAPTSGAVSSLIYFTQVREAEYKPGGDLGQLIMASVAAKGNKPLIRGTVMHPQGTARTATGTGTGIQLGAITSAQRMFANLHVMSYVDGSLTVKLQSSVDNTFASPTDQITFTASTALDAQASSVLGAVTDTWWRAVWTISGGSTHSFLFNVSAGIGPK